MMRIKGFTLLTLLLAAVAACDDGPAAPERAGYDITVSGDVAARARGAAFFGADEDGNGNAIFGLVLGADTAQHSVLLAKDGATAPARGEHRIRAPGAQTAGWDALYILSDGDELLGLMVADSGRIVITESSPTRLAGTIDLFASGLLEDGPGTARVRVTGTFDARPGMPVVATMRGH